MTGHLVSGALALAVAVGVAACSALPADTRIAHVGGRGVAYRVLGSGRPVLVMISGLGDGMSTFKDVAPDLAAGGTVILYDRAGYGGSTPSPGPRDAAGVAQELSALLPQTGVPGPYVLLGHSLGGAYAEYFAATHPDQVAALVLEESRPSDFAGRCAAAKASLCAPPALLIALSPPGARAEFAGMEAAMAQVRAAGPLAGKPVLVLSRPISPRPSAFDAVWRAAQADLAARYRGSVHLTAPGGDHQIHKDERAWFVAQVRGFLKGVR